MKYKWNEEVLLTEEEMSELIKEWQTRLYLEDWVVRLEVVSCDRMLRMTEGKRAVAFIVHNFKRLSAIVYIINKDDEVEGQGDWPRDMEQEVLHELLHLVVRDDTKSDTLKEDLYEQSIEVLSRALLALKRGGLECRATLSTQEMS